MTGLCFTLILRNSQIVFCSGGITLYFHEHCESSSFSVSSLTLAVVTLYNFSHSNQFVVIHGSVGF